MLLTQPLSFSKTLNPSSFSISQSPISTLFSDPFLKTLTHKPKFPKQILCFTSLPQVPVFSPQNPVLRRDFRSFAGRSKKKPGGRSPGRIEGNKEVRREAKRNARIKSKKSAESLFYRLKNPNKNYADNFSEEELQMIGLGYDRMVRFMEKDDPNLRHPYDWYKYGEFGPYSWRGVVVGEPMRGRFSDECVTLIGNVRDYEEGDKILQYEMNVDFGNRLTQMDRSVGFRYFWVFVRHPKWRVSEFPWQQWTLVSEVVVEAGKQRLDKWNLMGRLGNKTRSLITQCAAWMRPDIIYVKRPVYQCRFEPQDNFFRVLTPYLDPASEQNHLVKLKNEDGSFELCTYFGGLCKIAKVSPKAFVDDVVNAYEKLNDENKSKCLEFLLTNHPLQLLHPYTKEWKAKLEEFELGCDAPDNEDDGSDNVGGGEITDWIEVDGDDEEREYDIDGGNVDDDEVVDMEEGEFDKSDIEDDDSSAEEDEKYWEKEFQKAASSADAMENLAKRSAEKTTKFYKKQIKTMEEMERKQELNEDGDETALRGAKAKVSPEEWKVAGIGPWRRRIKKSRIPPELFLRAAVRHFTYRNLVKEIVLTRHAILDGEIGSKV